jgi:hypothetical protein
MDANGCILVGVFFEEKLVEAKKKPITISAILPRVIST